MCISEKIQNPKLKIQSHFWILCFEFWVSGLSGLCYWKNCKQLEGAMNSLTSYFHKWLAAGLLGLLLCSALPHEAQAQFKTKWLAAGSLHNWFSEIGGEIEEGLEKVQQYGLRWPAIYDYQDMQAARGTWIGVQNFTDEFGTTYPHKVVHVGPRVSGSGEFFPMEFKMVSRFAQPLVYVDGAQSLGQASESEEIDPTIPADVMIVNVTNTQTGITMTRRIMQFSQQYHDNYHVYEYTLTNTGNTDADAEIELPNKTLEGVYVFFQYRNSVCRETRYVIGNETGWGKNTMNDARGDGVKPDPANENFRAQFSWHGKYPPFTRWDNVGAPIWVPDTEDYVAANDTVGRLGAAQFVGVVTLHADKSAADESDDPSQPSTTTHFDSDDPLTSGNSPYNPVKMTLEYELMASGHINPRHADRVEPSGNFAEPTGDPALGGTGGHSFANGYGPYTLGPGESVRIVLAEGAAGLSREQCIEVGRRYKNGLITAREKNLQVLTGRDSLFQTFRRAIANYQEGYDIPRPPQPPSVFYVDGKADRVQISWEIENDPNLRGFRIYRATGRRDSAYSLIGEVDAGTRAYDDTQNLQRGVNYYYNIVSVGDPAQNNGGGQTPAGALLSSRYYSQTYVPTTLKRAPGETLSQIRVVPNPFSLGADQDLLRFPDERDRIAFFDIPGQCTIQIFTESGELVNTIEHTDGTGDAYWNAVTSANQIVVSGIYIALITDRSNGQKHIAKFVVVR
jgi:hypothetical protein